MRDTQSPRQEMGVYIGLTLQGENKWAQVFSDCKYGCSGAPSPHSRFPPTPVLPLSQGESAARALARTWGSGPGIQEEAVRLL
ncbi:hypothetical protein Q8A67_021392 [Cirrhinus molitorella]|uniref:Uncharacterized protein n=1 Tax=Cirrhinus molitorella TaxID=172907 RepID=A0AA88TBX3_9TELE|nr:hypothetical protein Q8A67_021392 [Cirrhinus molitorella]